jgi:hypothetical protein
MFLLGRCSFVDAAETIAKPPVKSPDPPIPAIALPIIKAVEDGATPHTREPISKITTNMKNVA